MLILVPVKDEFVFIVMKRFYEFGESTTDNISYRMDVSKLILLLKRGGVCSRLFQSAHFLQLQHLV